MKSIAKHAGLGVLALAFALLETVPAAADPQPAQNEGCLGETVHVTTERHVHTITTENPLGSYDPAGTKIIVDFDSRLRGTYVSELRNGKVRWVSRSIDWNVKSSGDTVGCTSGACEGSGHLELGATDGPANTMTDWQKSRMKMSCKGKSTGAACFGAWPYWTTQQTSAPLQFPELRARTRDELRLGFFYVAVDPDGTRYSEWVEQRGNEKVSIMVDPVEIVPNQSGTGNASTWLPTNPDEATSQVTVTATCDGKALKDRKIALRIDVKPNSGHHIHVVGRPRGKLAPIPPTVAVWQTTTGLVANEADCGVETGMGPWNFEDTYCILVKTDENGKAKVKFKSPLTPNVDQTAKGGPYRSGIAGDYKITAKDWQFTEVSADTVVHAKVGAVSANALQRANSNDNLELTGATDAHPDGLWGMHTTLDKFEQLAKSFHDAQVKHNNALKTGTPSFQEWIPIKKLSLNDIALMDGGIFDLGQNWQGGHFTHSKGQGGDFNRFTEDEDKTAIDCDGSTANLQIWYLQTLVELGKNYGKWDCTDLGEDSLLYNFSSEDCKAGNIPTGKHSGYFIYIPPKLHLHVDD